MRRPCLPLRYGLFREFGDVEAAQRLGQPFIDEFSIHWVAPLAVINVRHRSASAGQHRVLISSAS